MKIRLSSFPKEQWNMPESFRSIRDILENEPQLSNYRAAVKEKEVLAQFHEVLPKFAEHVKPVKVFKKTLYLKVENPSWRTEMKFQEEKIIEYINEFFKEERITQIRFFG